MTAPFYRKIFDFIFKKIKKQTTKSPTFVLLSRLIRGLNIASHIGVVLLILAGVIPLFRVNQDALLPAIQHWFSITFFAIIIHYFIKGFELGIHDSEVEEDRRNAQHLRELQWQTLKNSQKKDAIERGIRIANACTELLNSPKFDHATKEEARFLLIEIFQDEEAVDNFIKFSHLSKFKADSLGQAKDEGIVITAGDNRITVQDIRRIESIIGNRFSLSLSALKDWSQNYKNGINTLDQRQKSIARSDLIKSLETKFKGTARLSSNFKDAFERVFLARL